MSKSIPQPTLSFLVHYLHNSRLQRTDREFEHIYLHLIYIKLKTSQEPSVNIYNINVELKKGE